MAGSVNLRPFGVFCAGLSVVASAGAAQQDMINEVWLALGKHCGPIVESKSVDPKAFENLPLEHRIGVSSDGRRIQIDHQTEDLQWSLSVSQSDLGGRRYISCDVGYHNLQQLADVSALAADLRVRLEASGATDISGGVEQQIKITPLYATPGSGIDQTVQLDAVGVLPSEDFILHFQVFSYGIGAGISGDVPLSDVE